MWKGWKRVCAGALAMITLATTVLPGAEVHATEQSVTEEFTARDYASEKIAEGDPIKICVVSDTHYYPLNYVSDCEDYKTYVGGDPKMLAESGSIIDAALEMIKADAPDLVLISGDLTKDGEKQGHQDMAAKLQKLEDETDTEVFVINGNHDVYNYQDSCTFENGHKESAETTTPEEFRQIYSNFGYNGEYGAKYYTPQEGKQAGGLSYSLTFGDYVIVGIDSGRYSPDADTGMDTNEHITAGRIDVDLLPWLKEQVAEGTEKGKTVIGLMHHGLVPHFSKEAELLSEYVVDDWQYMASELADAGMRYIFTGHMRANDIAEYTSVNGNKIYDLETGSLAAYGTPVRSVTIGRDQKLTDQYTMQFDETFHVKSTSVKSIDYNGQHIEDLKSYTMEKLYPEKLFNNMAAGMLKPMIKDIADTGLRQYLTQEFPELDINSMIIDAVKNGLETGMNIELGAGIGRVVVTYRNGQIELKPTGTAGIIGETYITDDQIIRVVDDLLGKVETQYLKQPEFLLQKIDEIVTQVSQFGVTSLDAEQKTLYDFIVLLLTNHYAGGENPPTWVTEQVLPYLTSGDVIRDLIVLLVPSLVTVVEELASQLNVNTGIAFSGLWLTAINSFTNNGNLGTMLEKFGVDITEIVDDLISEYMSESFLTGMGGLLNEYASSFLFDTDSPDDILDDENGRTITWSTTTPVVPQDPTVENGLAPTQITMTQGEQADEKYVRWYTGAGVSGAGVVQISEEETFAEYQTYMAECEEVVKPKTLLNLGLLATYTTQKAKKYTAKINGLEAGKTYYYRVGIAETENMSTPVAFTIKNEEHNGFTFINVNDSQGMISSDYEVYLQTLESAKNEFPGAAFVLHSGDFVDDGSNEDYWTWALDGVSKSMSHIPTAGNHEAKSKVEGVTDPNPIVSHFKVQNQDIPEQDLSSGIYYSYEYQNATFIVLNTNDVTATGSLSEAQYNWAYEKAKQAKTDWKIILMHKSPYSNGPHANDKDVVAIRKQMNQLAAECDVDLVLSGHDHVYNRTPFLTQGNVQSVQTKTTSYQGNNYTTAMNPSGTVFVIAGTAGVKNYVQKPVDTVPSLVSFQQTGSVYAGVTIEGGQLYYRAYERQKDGTSRLVDSFAIDKTKETDVPQWEKVEQMIEALPGTPTLEDRSEIEAARTAYEELSEEEKMQVSNVDRLIQIEKLLRTLETIDQKKTVHVNNKKEFVKAFDDPEVGTIITDGATIEFENTWGNENIYEVKRNLQILGSSKLTYVSFHVKDGATLILGDNVFVDDTRTQGSLFKALNPVEIYDGSTLITTGSAKFRTDYGTGGAEQGACVKLVGEQSKAILGSKGNYWGAEAAVYAPNANSEVIVYDGIFERKNDNHRAVDSYGNIEVHGGTIQNLWCGQILHITGGVFDNGSSNHPHAPIEIENTAYMTGGQVVPHNGNSVKVKENAKLHIYANGIGQVTLGNVQPFVGYVTTKNYKEVQVNYKNLNGTGEPDGIYETTATADTVESLANAGGIRIENGTVSDGKMEATLEEGNHHVYGKYYLAGGGKNPVSGIHVEGAGEAIVYGPTRLIENHPVTEAVIEGEETRLVPFKEGTVLRLNGYTLPNNAFDNAVEWESDNEQVAVVRRGMVTLKGTGVAHITMRSLSKPEIFDQVTIVSMDRKIQGPSQVTEDTPVLYTVEKADHLPEEVEQNISYQWSVDDLEVASIDANTGELTKLGQGQVNVIANVLYNGRQTDVRLRKTIRVLDLVSVEITWGDMEYRFEKGTWDPKKHQYEEQGWKPILDESGQIQIQNKGQKPIQANLQFIKEEGFQIEGTFLHGQQSITQLVVPAKQQEMVLLQLNNEPEKKMEKETIGKITITIDQESE